MGSDDLFKKRKAKSIKDSKRKIAKRKPYDRVLIVCEGEKTEPLYFEGLRAAYNLHSANISITGDCGSDPMSVFKFAKEIFNKSIKDNNKFDKVYCVFDKDMHTNYSQTLDAIRTINIQPESKNLFTAITSVPCFEYWLLLHFSFTTNPYDRSTSVLEDLKKHLPSYEKGQTNIFEQLGEEKLNLAVKNAKQANEQANICRTDNPTTKIVDLVEYLQNLRA